MSSPEMSEAPGLDSAEFWVEASSSDGAGTEAPRKPGNFQQDGIRAARAHGEQSGKAVGEPEAGAGSGGGHWAPASGSNGQPW